MTRRRKRHDRQLKVSAAEVVLSGGMTAKSLSEGLGIKDSTSRRRAAEYDKTAEAAFSGNGSPKADKDRGIVKLKKKANARIEREALEGLAVDASRRHKGRCGCRRIDQELRRGGIVASGKRVPHIMRKPGIAA